MTDRTVEECAKIAQIHVGAGGGPGYDEACRDIAWAIRAMVVPQPMTLWGQIAAVYGNLDAEDCAWVDREWMKMRKIATEQAVPPQDGGADAPGDDDNTMREDPMFNCGVQHVVDLLAKTLEPLGAWHAGDGSEDYDCDLEETLRNILAAKGLFDKETGEFAGRALPREEVLTLLRSAFNEGFAEGCNERTKFNGGKTWSESIVFKKFNAAPKPSPPQEKADE